jgi:hypothetical protein
VTGGFRANDQAEEVVALLLAGRRALRDEYARPAGDRALAESHQYLLLPPEVAQAP